MATSCFVFQRLTQLRGQKRPFDAAKSLYLVSKI